MDYQSDKLLSQRAKQICKFILESESKVTFDEIMSAKIDGSRSTIRFALCELIDVGYIKPLRVKAEGERFKIVYVPITCDLYDPTQESFWEGGGEE